MTRRAFALAAVSLGTVLACTRTPPDDDTVTSRDSTTVSATIGRETTTVASAIDAPTIDSPAIIASASPSSRSNHTPTLVTADTLRGVVLVVGAVPETMVALRTAGGTITLGGPAVPALRSVVGAEVFIAGRRGGDPLRAWLADRFIVRAVDGKPARDGVLESDGDALVLRPGDGSHSPIVNPPVALRTHIGRRVWVTGVASATPESWGVITPR